MKRNNLAAAVIAGVAGIAGITSVSTAVNINPDGLGEVLIYPYYTVNGDNDTLISLVNTTEEVKAVKVRIIEAQNSDEVLDFNLYMSPEDVWVAALTADGDTGPGMLVTSDTSCTVPQITGPIEFKNDLFFNGAGAADDDDDTSLERTREGYIEIIEMGVVDETVDAATTTGLEAAAIHGATHDCDELEAAWAVGVGGAADGVWVTNAGLDVSEPTGGLFGGGWIINVGEATMVTYNADAISAFYDPLDPTMDLHRDPGNTDPSLADAATGATDPQVQSIVFDNGQLVTSVWNEGIDAVSAVFMHNEIYNEYVTDPDIAGVTEWAITFPTKKFYVNGATPDEPFQNVWDGAESCDTVSIDYRDREESAPVGGTSGPCFSPCTPASPVDPELCYEANVVTFNQPEVGTGAASVLFGSPLAQNIDTLAATSGTTVFTEGFATIGFPWIDVDGSTTVNAGDAHFMTSADGDTYIGLPVTGFAAIAIGNNTQCVDDDMEVVECADGLQQVFANYAGAFRHRADRDITP